MKKITLQGTILNAHEHHFSENDSAFEISICFQTLLTDADGTFDSTHTICVPLSFDEKLSEKELEEMEGKKIKITVEVEINK